MAKSKQDKTLYRRLRGSGVRKKVARRLTESASTWSRCFTRDAATRSWGLKTVSQGFNAPI
jgi:hypothetical protein